MVVELTNLELRNTVGPMDLLYEKEIYSDPSLYRASPIAASLLRGIFYSES